MAKSMTKAIAIRCGFKANSALQMLIMLQDLELVLHCKENTCPEMALTLI
jgi:hypothetical protein